MDKELVEQIRRLRDGITKQTGHYEGVAVTKPREPEKPKLAAALKSGDADAYKFSDVWGIAPSNGLPDIVITAFDGDDWHESVRSCIPSDEDTYVPQGLNEFMFTKAMESNQRVLLTGPAGSGKSTLPKVFAARTCRPFFRFQCNQSTEFEDLFGNLSVRGGEVVWIDGPVTQAARYGGIVCLDEVSTLRAGAALGLQWLLERGGKIHLPSFPSDDPSDKYVTPHDEFRIALTDNTNLSGDDTGRYVGTNVQNAALKDRIDLFIRVAYMSSDAEFSMVKKHVPSIDDSVLKNMVRFAGEIRNGFEKGSCESTVSPRVLLRWARDTVAFGNIGFALRYTLVNGASADDETVIASVYKKVFGETLPGSTV